ncbi:MAG: AAA family ATPase [Gammaproteobacteria bacterium]
MLYILFGLPAAGKDYVAALLKQSYGFFHYNADIDLTPEMLEYIKNQKIFSQSMRDKYFEMIINKISDYTHKFKNVVVSQGLAKEINRHQLKLAFPQATFILINTDDEIRNKRLRERNDWITVDYAQRIKNEFEKPCIPHYIIENKHDNLYVLQQLAEILPK